MDVLGFQPLRAAAGKVSDYFEPSPETILNTCPKYSIIIPAPGWNEEWPSLVALRENPPGSSFEIIVALGRHPAVQRNAALKQATGAVVIFLDSDSSIATDFWEVLELSLKDETVDILGGPSLLQKRHNAWEPIFQTLLTNPFIVGPMSHRYKPSAANASATQADLILCNLVARQSVFNTIGNFSSRLFPNEENEWMERATNRGLKILYQPLLQVSRPQRKTIRQFFYTMIRYGIGRTHQFQISRQLALPMVAPLLLIIGLVSTLLGLLFLGWWITLLILVGSYASLGVFQGITSLFLSVPRPSLTQFAVVSFLAPFVPVTYAIGQLLGWRVKGSGAETAPVLLVNEQNIRL